LFWYPSLFLNKLKKATKVWEKQPWNYQKTSDWASFFSKRRKKQTFHGLSRTPHFYLVNFWVTSISNLSQIYATPTYMVFICSLPKKNNLLNISLHEKKPWLFNFWKNMNEMGILNIFHQPFFWSALFW
jgi:hypothetical protein